MGGLSRKLVTVQEMRKAGEDPLILDSGDLFFSTPDLNKNNIVSEQYRAGSMLRGYEKIGCDAINVGRYELLLGLDFLKEKVKSTTIPFISANLRDGETGSLLFEPYRIIQRGSFTVGIIGLTSMVKDSLAKVTTDDYLETGRSYLKKIKSMVDIVVMLINTDQKNYSLLPAKFPDADFIFVSGSTMLTRPSIPQEKEGPYLYSSGKEGRRLTVIDVNRENDIDRLVDVSYYQNTIDYINRRFERLQKQDPGRPLVEIYAGQEKTLNLIRDYQQELETMETILDNAINILEFQNIPMGDTIKDDPGMLSFVDQSLAACGSLKISPINTKAIKTKISNEP